MNREDIIKLFAENLRIERARKKLPQEKLAELANITPEYLSRIESGKFSPSLVVITNLALALDVSLYTDDNQAYGAKDNSDDGTVGEMDEDTRSQYGETQIDQEKIFSNGFVEVDEDGNISEDEFGDEDSDFDDSEDNI